MTDSPAHHFPPFRPSACFTSTSHHPAGSTSTPPARRGAPPHPAPPAGRRARPPPLFPPPHPPSRGTPLHDRRRAVALPMGRHAGYGPLDIHPQDALIETDLQVGHPVGAPRLLLPLADGHQKAAAARVGSGGGPSGGSHTPPSAPGGRSPEGGRRPAPWSPRAPGSPAGGAPGGNTSQGPGGRPGHGGRPGAGEGAP